MGQDEFLVPGYVAFIGRVLRPFGTTGAIFSRMHL